MGFFSWECNGCGHSILSSYSIDAINAWMSKVVLLEDQFIYGIYDGYGRILGELGDIEFPEEPCVYHQACFYALGQPEDMTPSVRAADQGYFFDDEHNIPEPKTGDDVYNIYEGDYAKIGDVYNIPKSTNDELLRQKRVGEVIVVEQLYGKSHDDRTDSVEFVGDSYKRAEKWLQEFGEKTAEPDFIEYAVYPMKINDNDCVLRFLDRFDKTGHRFSAWGDK